MILKVDVDASRKLSRAALEQRARIAHVVILSVTDVRSPSGRGWHRTIAVERLGRGPSKTVGANTLGTVSRSPYPTQFSALEVVALQLLFGSDPIREAFNLHRARLVDAGQVPRFFARRWNTLYDTSRGKVRTV